MDDNADELGKNIDSLDNLYHALLMPLPDKMHVECIRESLKELIPQFKKNFAAVVGENPWEE